MSSEYPHNVICVLITQGRREHVAYAKVVIFEKHEIDKANEYVKRNNKADSNYWTKAEIMTRGDSVDLTQP